MEYLLNNLISEGFSLPKGMDVPEENRKLFNLNKIFVNNNPVIIEIGFGNAEFISNMATHNRDKNYIGIELSPISIKKAMKLIDKNDLVNVRLLKLDAKLALKYFIPNDSIQEFYINFPDPWPKKKHAKNRLISYSVVETLLSKLKPEGRLYFVTDWRDYAFESREVFSKFTVLESVFGENWFVSNIENYFSTKYEKKWKEINREIYYQCYKKVL